MKLNVLREFRGAYELVGFLEGEPGSTSFSYDADYLGHGDSISPSLPLQEVPFDAARTRCFFEGLAPEGSLRRDIEDVRRVARVDYLGVLDAVRDEPVGALLFSGGDAPAMERGYDQLDFERVQRLAEAPAQIALDLTLSSRISLAGAQSKVGLHHDGEAIDAGWFLPRGTAPSTHILKACSPSFPGETICEALCMRAAAKFDLPAERCRLIAVPGHEPILVAERYDRAMSEAGAEMLDGLAVPLRLHQVDMCQASGSISSALKYEPTGVNYLSSMADVLYRFSTDQLADRATLGYYQLFDYAVGNCDNHLKNWSLLWGADWKSIVLAPLYDVVDTTIYPQLVREMGVSFGGSRVIDDVDRSMVEERLATCGIPPFMRTSIIEDTVREVPAALADAADELMAEGFPQATEMLERMMPGVEERLARLR